MIKLHSDIPEFTHIVHLADIQIRLTKRHDEYREVFLKLLDSVAKLPETTINCIVGDVVHSKLDLSPECVQVTKEFLVGLADLHPTVLVAGNHDTNLTNKNRLDSLSPIVEAIHHPNLFYLKKTDLFGLGDVCFNNYSVFDDETMYLKADKIPSVYKNEYRHLICLFHGTVDGATSEMGFKLVNKNIPLSFFDGHDAVLLGDIHKLQTLQLEPPVHYCGSLIQQNHGEELNNHGYTLWDLKKKTFDHVEVRNDYGYFTIKIDKGEIKTDLTTIPKKARVRLSCFESLPTETKAALKEIKKVTELVEPPTYTREAVGPADLKATSTVNLVHGDIRNRDHQIKLLQDFLKNKLKVEDEGLLQEIIKINDETNADIKTDDIAKNVRWAPIRFEWENLFSFGEDNVIDFTKLTDVVGLFATNASGKSSVFSSLSWCIFDKCERDFKANNIINDQKMSCRALLEVLIGDVRYFIERTGKMDKKGAVKVNVRFWRVIGDKEEELTGIERSDTNNAIRNYLGNYEDFLLTSLSVQKSGKYETSFIDLGDSGRKDLLAQFLGLNLFDVLHEASNKKLHDIVSTLKVYKNEDMEGELKATSDALSQSESALDGENKKLKELNDNKETIRKSIIEEQARLVKIEGVVFTTSSTIESTILDHQKSIERVTLDTNTLIGLRDSRQNKIETIEKTLGHQDLDLLEKNYAAHKGTLEQLSNVSISLNQKITEARPLKEKADKIKDYHFDPNCSFCVENADVVMIEGKKAEAELEKYRIEIKAVMETKSLLEKKKAISTSAEISLNDYNNLTKERNKLKDELYDYEKKILLCNEKLNTLKKNLEDAQKELEVFNKNKDAFVNNELAKRSIEKYEKDFKHADYLADKQDQLVRSLVGKVSVFKSKIEDLKKKMEKVKEVEKQFKAYDLYTQSVSRDGIPYEVIASAVPHIEAEVNSILGQVVDFYARFDIDGKNIIPYIVRDERHWLMSLGSNMEQFILSIAIRVALTNLSNLPKMNGIVIDEGFGALDSEHLSTIPSLFHYLKSNFDFVIIISHLEVMRDFVDSRMDIKKENGFSKVNFT